MENETVILEKKLNSLIDVFPSEFMNLSTDQQTISLQIYRLLAEGQPVALAQIAETTGLKKDLIETTLDSWPGVYYDDARRIIGYWGLALPKMTHRFQVNGITLYTWCAWDTLFIPALIQKTAEVESKCALTGEKVRLTITPNGITQTDPDNLGLSFVAPEEARIKENVISSFCHFVHFFRSPTDAEQWVSEHAGTFTLSLAEAYHLGRNKNEMQYKDTLWF
jgi:alkylmercury lyase